MVKKLIIAHRGGLALAKENTLAALRNAVALGADMIELDIRRNKDGVMVANHDETIDPEAPAFEEMLAYTQGKIKLDVELKEMGYEKEAVELLLKYFQPDEFVITSFNDVTVKTVKKLFPEINVGLILGKEIRGNFVKVKLWEFFPHQRFKASQADFLVSHRKLLKLNFLSRIKKYSQEVFIWTVNNEKLLKQLLLDERVAGIITDRPDLALKIRREVLYY